MTVPPSPAPDWMCVVTAVEEPTTTFVRPDGREKVTGAGRYTADLTFTGQLHAAFRYADHPHARITRIDTTRARALPGVIAVVTHEDVPDVLYGGMVKDRRLFARDTVRFEGDIVAGVAATTEAIAREAAALVEVDLEPLPVVSDFEAALEPDATRVHPDWESYEGDEALGRHDNVLGFSTIVKGDVEAALAASDVVVRGRFVTDPVQGVPIEPRAIVAQWQGDRVTVWSSTQVPYAARAGVAQTLEIPESDVRVIVPLLGGGFGAKCDFHFEGHVAALARAAGRPVKLVFSRHEEFVAVGHRREGMVIELETGARSDGTILARRARLVLDSGAYCGEGGFFAQMAAMHAHGPYELGSVDIESSLVYSNNQPSSSIRAPTAPQVCWALEQHMDELAEALGLDPVELRRRTLIEDGLGDRDRPGARADRDEGDARARRRADRRRRRAARGRGDRRRLRLVAVLRRELRRVRQAQPRRHRHDHDWRAGERHRGGDGDAAASSPRSWGCARRTSRSSTRTPTPPRGTWARAARRRRSTACAPCSRPRTNCATSCSTPRRRSSRRRADDLELVGGSVRVKGSADKAVTIAELAADGTFHGKGSGDVPEAPPAPAEGCVGRLGNESFHAPQLIAHAAHVTCRPRDGRRARASRCRRARLRRGSSTASARTARSTAAS